MEIKNSGNNKYLAILSKEDFEQYDLYPDEIISGKKSKAEHLPIKEIVEKIVEVTGDDSIFSCQFIVKVAVNKDKSQILFELEKCERDEEPFDIFSLLRDIHNKIMEMAKEEEERAKQRESLTDRAIFAKTISDAIELTAYCPKKIVHSSLLKTKDGFYLFVSMPQEMIESFDMVAGEYFDKIEKDGYKMAYIKEHAEVVIDENAISVLHNIM